MLFIVLQEKLSVETTLLDVEQMFLWPTPRCGWLHESCMVPVAGEGEAMVMGNTKHGVTNQWSIDPLQHGGHLHPPSTHSKKQGQYILYWEKSNLRTITYYSAVLWCRGCWWLVVVTPVLYNSGNDCIMSSFVDAYSCSTKFSHCYHRETPWSPGTWHWFELWTSKKKQIVDKNDKL